jgi:arylsulfatase A-like enzyme
MVWLDQHVKDKYTMVITADHGVQSIPEVARDMGRTAGRIGMRNPAELKLDGERVKRAYRDAARKMRGVSDAFTNSALLTMDLPKSDTEAAVRRSFRADRSGDVLIALSPGYIWDYSGTGTTHGQPVPDDQHVPVMFWGRGIVAGRFDDAIAPTDIAKTIAALYGVDAGGTQSQVLPAIASANR